MIEAIAGFIAGAVITAVVMHFRRKDVPTPPVIRDLEDKARAKYGSDKEKP